MDKSVLMTQDFRWNPLAQAITSPLPRVVHASLDVDNARASWRASRRQCRHAESVKRGGGSICTKQTPEWSIFGVCGIGNNQLQGLEIGRLLQNSASSLACRRDLRCRVWQSCFRSEVCVCVCVCVCVWESVCVRVYMRTRVYVISCRLLIAYTFLVGDKGDCWWPVSFSALLSCPHIFWTSGPLLFWVQGYFWPCPTEWHSNLHTDFQVHQERLFSGASTPQSSHHFCTRLWNPPALLAWDWMQLGSTQ